MAHEITPGVSEQEGIQPKMGLQDHLKVAQPEMVIQDQVQAEMLLQDQEVVQAEMGLQDQEVIEPGLSLQEKEFQAQMDAPEEEDIQPKTGLQKQSMPPGEVATVAALPESSAEIVKLATPESIPDPTEPAKPPTFEAPDTEMEEGELEDELGQEQQITLAQDKIQILTKDVSIQMLKHAYISCLSETHW